MFRFFTRKANLSAASSICLCRFARAMTRLRLDADQNRRRAGLRCLQCCSKLERMSGHDAIVMIGSRDQRRRILRSRLDVVKRRILAQNLELFRIVRTSRSPKSMPSRS